MGAVVNDTAGVPQLSVAVGATQLATAQPLAVDKVIFVGQLVKVGGVASVSHGSSPFVVTTISLSMTQTCSHLSLKKVTNTL